jgi:hypothetical protein
VFIHLAASALSAQGDATAEPVPRTLHVPVNRIERQLCGRPCSWSTTGSVSSGFILAFLEQQLGNFSRSSFGRAAQAELDSTQLVRASASERGGGLCCRDRARLDVLHSQDRQRRRTRTLSRTAPWEYAAPGFALCRTPLPDPKPYPAYPGEFSNAQNWDFSVDADTIGHVGTEVWKREGEVIADELHSALEGGSASSA